MDIGRVGDIPQRNVPVSGGIVLPDHEIPGNGRIGLVFQQVGQQDFLVVGDGDIANVNIPIAVIVVLPGHNRFIDRRILLILGDLGDDRQDRILRVRDIRRIDVPIRRSLRGNLLLPDNLVTVNIRGLLIICGRIHRNRFPRRRNGCGCDDHRLQARDGKLSDPDDCTDCPTHGTQKIHGFSSFLDHTMGFLAS